MAYVHQEYPKWLYHATMPTLMVQNVDHHLACYKQGYRESSDEARALQPVSDGAVPVASAPATPPAAPTPPPKPPTEEEIEAASRKALHDTPVEAAVAVIAESTDEAGLLRARSREALNPKHPGGRKGIVKAIDDRMADLIAAAPPAAEPTVVNQ